MSDPGRVSGRLRVGVDIGGTFTDIVVAEPGGVLHRRKLPSTTDDYARGIIDGLVDLIAEIGADAEAVADIVHATTIGTNTVLERSGAQTALVTSHGFRDVLEIGRLRRPRLYDMGWEKPAPLVERRLRIGVHERVSAGGEILRPLSEAAVQAVLKSFGDDGIDSLAVCLMHSYANPAHERQIERIAEQLLPGVHISISSRVLPEQREYERTSTTVLNAYIAPRLANYLQRLRSRLDSVGISAPLLMMQSSGGVCDLENATQRPVNLLESGPAAGVIAAAAEGQRASLERIITLDVGGTTAKSALVEKGSPTQSMEFEVGGDVSTNSRLMRGSGHLVRLPTIDVSEVGAGGGSLIALDSAGGVHVGPQSAGAIPGPACYGRGSDRPTVTDASVVLGYLNPRELAGGAIQLDAAAARSAVKRDVADPLDVPLLEAAYGCFLVASANMSRAVRAVSVAEGRDPRDFMLFAYGGSGGVYGAEIARSLEMRSVVIPPTPGLFSAFGLLFAEVEHVYVQSLVKPLHAVTSAELREHLGRMEDDARAVLMREGYANDRVGLRRAVDLRYLGQSFALRVELPAVTLTHDTPASHLAPAFDGAYAATYGHRVDREQIELVNLVLTAQGQEERARPIATSAPAGAQPVEPACRDVYFGPQAGTMRTPVLSDRDEIGGTLRGPLIVEEYDGTTVVPPDGVVRRDAFGNLVIELDGGDYVE